MKKQLILSSIFFMLLSVIACKKGEQGNIGPAGVAGAKGAKGTTGDKGAADSKGMISSDWIAVKGTDWRISTVANTYFVSYTASGLTVDIVNKGMIYVYMKQETNARIVDGLPYVNITTGHRFYSLIGLSNGVPAIQFYQSVTPPSSTFSTTTNVSFRYVVVPAGARMANIDWNNYDEVKKALNWEDQP